MEITNQTITLILFLFSKIFYSIFMHINYIVTEIQKSIYIKA